MSIEVFECDQGSDDWFKLRAGIPTSSEFKSVMAEGRGGKTEAATRRTYLLKLVGERVTGKPKYDYQNGHMLRGKEMEDQARELYALTRPSTKLRKVGFVRNNALGAGASPDSLIIGPRKERGGLEIKTKLAHVQLEVLLAKKVPSEHRWQLQGQLWVCELDWIDFVSYWPGLPLYVERVYRDERAIEALAEAVRVFNMEVNQLTQEIQQYSQRAA